MPTTMTLDGVRTDRIRTFFRNVRERVGLGAAGDIAPAPDPWAASNAFSVGPNPSAEFLRGVLGWGILAFALGTAAYRGWDKIEPYVASKPKGK